MSNCNSIIDNQKILNINFVMATLSNIISSTTQAIAIAIVNRHGELIAFSANDNCFPLPRKVAFRKAYTASLLRRETAIVSEEVKTGRLNLSSLNDPLLLAMPGGIPIIIEENIIGAVGVSGLTAEQDIALAKQYIDRLLSFKE